MFSVILATVLFRHRLLREGENHRPHVRVKRKFHAGIENRIRVDRLRYRWRNKFNHHTLGKYMDTKQSVMLQTASHKQYDFPLNSTSAAELW